MMSPTREGSVVPWSALLGGPTTAAGEELTDGTRESREPPVWRRRLSAKAVTGNTESKWTRQVGAGAARGGHDRAGGRREEERAPC